MFTALQKILVPSASVQQAHQLYNAIVAQARMPYFYEKAGVPDTLDGRFEMILLHLFLVLHRLKNEVGSKKEPFSRYVAEAFFTDMDRSLREIGVSDTGVGKRIKRMARAYFGRIQAYESAFTSFESLEESLQRNVYANAKSDAKLLTRYAFAAEQALSEQPVEALQRSEVIWPDFAIL